MKHTPGPWAIRRLNAIENEIVAGQIFIAGTFGLDQVSTANARLIAACPRMYEYITARADAGDSEAAEIVRAIHGRHHQGGRTRAVRVSQCISMPLESFADHEGED